MTTTQADENSWTTFEKLLLIQSVYKHGDNWLAISRTMKNHQMVSHAAEFFTQKNCTTKYNTLVDPLKIEAEIEDEHKKRTGEYINDKQRMPWTAKLARELYHERIDELKSSITSTETKFRKLVNDIDDIKSGKWDSKFVDMIKNEQGDKEKKAEEVSKTSAAEVPIESTDVISNIKIEPSVILPSTKVESVIPMDIDKNVTATVIEKDIVADESVEPLIEVNPSSTTEDMEVDIVPYIVPSPILTSTEVNKDAPQTPATPLAEPNESLVIEGQNIQMTTTVAANMEVQKDNIELPLPVEEEIIMMDIDEKVTEKPVIESLSASELESTLETDVSKAEQAKKTAVSPNAESVTAEDTPQTITAMDLCEQGVEIVPEIASESSEKVHYTENLVSSPSSMEEADSANKQEDIISKEHCEFKSQPSKITVKEEVDSKDAVKEKGKESEISEITLKQSAVSTKEETLDTIKSADSLSPIEPAAEIKTDKKEDISEEVKEDTEDVCMVDLSEENEEDKYSSKEKITPTPQAEFKEPLTPSALVSTTPTAVATPSNAPPSTPGDLAPPTPTHDTAPTPSASEETPDDKKLKTWQKLVSMMLHEINNHRIASVFQNPIREQDAPGYYDIVKQPMDLKTLKKRLREGTIHDTDLFHRDLMLMFMNASVFNREESDIHKMALEMKDHVETQISEFRRSEGSGGTHEPATRRKSMAIDADAAYITSDRRSENDRSAAEGSSHRNKLKDDAERPIKKKRLSLSQKNN